MMPCLNEAETLQSCIRQAKSFLSSNSIHGEVIVADNGSTDGSQEIAVREGARLVTAKRRGYGSALTEGFNSARGQYIAMGDADESYDFGTLLPFIEHLRAGDELVIGNRFAGGIESGAMPLHHKYFGNPLLSFIGRLFFGTPVRDFHCGLRAFNRTAILGLNLRTTGMEFASEMIVKASLSKLRISEVPTPLRRDGRSRAPHLRSFVDGWRHLRFLLLYSPRWLFLYPGKVLATVGLFSCARLLVGPIQIGSVNFDVASLLFLSALTIVGTQFISVAILSNEFALRVGLLPTNSENSTRYRKIKLEIGILIGFAMIFIGLIASFLALNYWKTRNFGDLNTATVIRVSMPGFLLTVTGLQIMVSTFFLEMIRIDTRPQNS